MADNDPVIQGLPGWLRNATQTPTQITSEAGPTEDGTGLYLFGSSRSRYGSFGLYVVMYGDNNPAVRSYSYGGDGVYGIAGTSAAPNSAGVRGESAALNGAGVHGQNLDSIGVKGEGATGVAGEGPIGIFGYSPIVNGIAVEGDASGDRAVGVFGAVTGSQSVGIYAFADTSDSAALQVEGRAVFKLAGRITIPANTTNATVSGLTLSSAAFAIATLQQNLMNVYVRAAVPNTAAGTLTVYLNQAPTVNATVGWMVVN